MKLRSVLAPSLLSVVLVACGHGGKSLRAYTPASQPHVIMVSDTLDPTQMRAAVARALARESFSPDSEQPGNVVATYTRGARMLKLAIEYNAQQVTFHYVDSQGMGGAVDAHGQVMLDKHYSTLVGKLDDAIKEELGRPAHEAAEQAKAQSEAAAAAERQARQDQIDAEERLRAYNIAMEHEKTKQARAKAEAEARAHMPPAIRVEAQPPAPGPDYYWTAGHWTLLGGQYQWVPGFWAQSYAMQAPPAAQVESPGLPPRDDYFWVRGQWRWNGSGYAWVGGHWDTSRVGYTYVPPFWDNRGGRWVHVEGHWISRGAQVETTGAPQ